MDNEELTKEIERIQKEFSQERRMYLKCIREIICHFVPNEEQREAIQADFLKRIQDHPSISDPAEQSSTKAPAITWKDLLTYNLKSEQLHDVERETLLGDCIIMPFGKYIGRTLGAIPLRYLDETVSVMPKTWIVRKVIEFVDLVMDNFYAEGAWVTTVPNFSLDDINEQKRAFQKHFQQEGQDQEGPNDEGI